MGVKGIETQTSYIETAQYAAGTKVTDKKEETKSTEKKDEFVKSNSAKKDSTKQIYKKNTALVNQLKQDAENRKQQLIDLVQKSIGNQGKAYNSLCELFTAIKDGKVAVDPAAVEQAKKDVAEDGYWGVKQTSDRFVEFAKALTGGDPSKADKMIEAIEKGFEQATKAWGGKLPDICSETIKVTKEKLTAWKNEMSQNNTDK